MLIVRELCTINYTNYVHCKRLEYVNRKVSTMRMYVRTLYENFVHQPKTTIRINYNEDVEN